MFISSGFTYRNVREMSNCQCGDPLHQHTMEKEEMITQQHSDKDELQDELIAPTRMT